MKKCQLFQGQEITTDIEVQKCARREPKKNSPNRNKYSTPGIVVDVDNTLSGLWPSSV